jgi:hypothetical protein
VGVVQHCGQPGGSMRCDAGWAGWACIGRDVAVNKNARANACDLFSTALFVMKSFRRNDKTYL